MRNLLLRKVTTNIKVGKYTFKGAVEIEGESSWENLTDTCILTLPRKAVFQGKAIQELIKKGDKVTVDIGYDGNNYREFEGYVREVQVKSPLRIICEDAMWLLKTGNITKSWRSVTVSELLKDILPLGVTYKCPDISLGQVRISNLTPVKILDWLRKDFGMPSFFRDGILYVGLAYQGDSKTVQLRFGKTGNIVQDDLEFRSKEDIKLKLVGISIKPNNTKEEVTVGDADGEQRTYHKYNISKEDMKVFLTNELETLRYDGWRGSVTTFGQPFIRHGDAVRIKDEQLSREGTFLVKKTTFKVSVTGGYRRTVYLDRKQS